MALALEAVADVRGERVLVAARLQKLCAIPGLLCLRAREAPVKGTQRGWSSWL